MRQASKRFAAFCWFRICREIDFYNPFWWQIKPTTLSSFCMWCLKCFFLIFLLPSGSNFLQASKNEKFENDIDELLIAKSLWNLMFCSFCSEPRNPYCLQAFWIPSIAKQMPKLMCEDEKVKATKYSQIRQKLFPCQLVKTFRLIWVEF